MSSFVAPGASSASGFFSASASSDGLDQTSVAERTAQAKALEQLLSTLLSAGYFRARVAALAPFDKLVGGLCWAISSSGAAVDVDLFYDEELALGAKIQLCEVIIKVLRAQQCPSPLQAHQIQGGDFVACVPVVRWLVTKVLEHRAITGDTTRTASESAFARTYAPMNAPRAAAAAAGYGAAVPAATAAPAVPAGRADDSVVAGSAFIAAVAARYRPLRRYRRLASLWHAHQPTEARLQSCLLEFGERTVLRAAVHEDDDDTAAGTSAPAKSATTRASGTDFERKFAAAQRAARADEETARRAAVERERGLLEQMADARAGVSGSSLGLFVGLQSEELRRAADGYRAKEDELRALASSGGLLANTKAGRAAAHERRLAALQTRLNAAVEARAAAEEALNAATAASAAQEAELAKAARYHSRALAGIAKVDATVAALPPAAQAQLRALFERHTRAEKLREEESAFKAACTSQLSSLQQRAAQLAAEAASGDAARELADMAALHGEAAARTLRARAAVAARTREVERLARLIDDVPSRGELAQYEKRFVELFDEVSEKLDETRKYFATYNTLARKREFMSKEDQLVSSMLANFSALSSRSQRQSYLDQCAAFISTMEDSLAKQAAALDARRRVRDARAAEVQRLVDLQRTYFKAVKEFQEECRVNDQLSAESTRRKAAAMTAAAAATAASVASGLED